MAKAPRKPSEQKAAETQQPAPLQQQQMQSGGSQMGGESLTEGEGDEGTSFANINP